MPEHHTMKTYRGKEVKLHTFLTGGEWPAPPTSQYPLGTAHNKCGLGGRKETCHLFGDSKHGHPGHN